MNPTVALLIGVILIGVVASGRARAVWDAITGNAPVIIEYTRNDTRNRER